MSRVILSFLISFILLMIVIALNRITYNKTQDFTEQSEHSRSVIKLLGDVDVELRSGEIFSPTYENSEAKDLYALYRSDLQKIQPHLLQLRGLVKDNKSQSSIVDSVSNVVKNQVTTLHQKNMVEIIKSGEVWRIRDLEKAHLLIRKALDDEELLLATRRADLLKSNKLNNTLTLLLAILAIVIVTITFFNQLFISKRSKWLEGFLESILNTSQNGVIYYKAVRKDGVINDFKVEFANQAIEQLLGINPSKVLGKNLSQLDSYTLKSPLFKVYVDAIETGTAVQLEHLYQHFGIERWLSLSIMKMDDGITVAFHNITALKQYEADLKQNIAALERSNRELEEYAYAASHDLQEPLRKIRTFGGFLQDTQRDYMTEKGRQQLDKMLQSAERMTLLIKDLLSFSSLKQKEEFELTALEDILQNVLQDLEVLIAQKAAIITHDALPEIDAIPIQMNQLFYNLVSNSLKFARNDLPLHLDISCRLLSSEEAGLISELSAAVSYYEIIFSDNGIGFNPDYAHQIFGLFKRLNDKNQYTGSGIGLALCKKVVLNHEGVISATGKEGVGAQFYIYLRSKQGLTSTLAQQS